ncbi:50S ribosomal protein L32e [Candidatus Woesearchaeota archaeon]|nr:50S ribosomal protein L32e [Candidatus Woesearchaeota archaeon]
MAQDIKRLLAARKRIKKRKPEFLRQSGRKLKRLKHAWRRPKGIDSKLRLNRRGHPSQVAIGFRSPAAVRGFHPTGMPILIVQSMKDIAAADPSKQGILIGSTVGLRLKIQLLHEAIKKKLTVFNVKDPAGAVKKAEEKLRARKEEKAKKKSEKTKKKEGLKKQAEKKDKEKEKTSIDEAVTEEEKKAEEKKEKDDQLIHTQ